MNTTTNTTRLGGAEENGKGKIIDKGDAGSSVWSSKNNF